MIETSETGAVLELREHMPVGERLLIVAISLLPLLAPWELLILPDWPTWRSGAFLFAAFVSAGALLVTFLLAAVAFAGLDTCLRVDRDARTLRSVEWAPLWRRRVREIDAGDVAAVAVEAHDFSDGAPTWGLLIEVRGQAPLRLASSFVRVEIEELAYRLAEHLRVPLAGDGAGSGPGTGPDGGAER